MSSETLSMLDKQLIVIFCTLFLTLASCYIPYFLSWFYERRSGNSKSLKENRKLSKFLSLSNCLAAGVILGALIMHLIPHVVGDAHGHGHSHDDHHQKHDGENEQHPYAFGLLAMGLSFLLLLSIDKVYGHAHSHHHEDLIQSDREHGMAHDISECPHDEEKSIDCCKKDEKCKIELAEFNRAEKQILNSSCASDVADECCHNETCTESECPSHLALPNHSKDDDCDHHHHHVHHKGGGCAIHGLAERHSEGGSQVKLLIFVLAMSLHSFLEGLSLGHVKNAHQFIGKIAGLLPHKVLESFALGMSIKSGSFSALMSHLLIIMFSTLTPLGSAVGLMASHLGEPSEAVKQIFDGLASGSFLFVACVEMIPHALDEAQGCRMEMARRISLITIGFSIMAALSVLHEHDHEH